MIIPENKTRRASFVVGSIGAVIGGLWCYLGVEETRLPTYILPVGIISGFLSCFFISKWYLKFMEDKTWRWGILFGPFFAVLAGTISGFVTMFSSIFEDIGSPYFIPEESFILRGLFGMLFGSVTGAVVGLVSSLTVGPIVARFTDERSGYVSGLTAGKGMTENLTERLSRPTWSLIGLILLAIAVLAALIYLAIQLA